MERVLNLLPTCHCRAAAVPHLRGASVRCVHDDHARHSTERDLERRDWHRAAQEGRGPVGQEVAVEIHRGGLRALLDTLALAIQSANN